MDSIFNNYCSFPPHAQFTFQEKVYCDNKDNLLKNETNLFAYKESLLKWNEKLKSCIIIKNSPRHSMKIFEIKDIVKNLLLSVAQLRSTENHLKYNIQTLSKLDWEKQMISIKNIVEHIEKLIASIVGDKLTALRKILSCRSTKRNRIKRQKKLFKNMLKIKNKKKCEISRSIDENLQKLTENTNKTKQEEAMKRKGDIILRDVLKRKADAKKSLSLIEGLLRLRRARFNTAKGRGGSVTEVDAAEFTVSMDKLKTTWTERINKYNAEEKELRLMMQETCSKDAVYSEINIVSPWKQIMFGQSHLLPQHNFKGDMHAFTSVRSQWDCYINEEGTPLPTGWLLPSSRTDIFNFATG